MSSRFVTISLAVTLGLLSVCSSTVSAQYLGDELWLQYGPYEWGRQLYSDHLLWMGTWYPRDVITYYPAQQEGWDTEVAEVGAPYPVLFFQHAGGSHYQNYHYLFSRLASHGIIVLSMDHNAWDSAPDFWEAHLFLFTETVDLGFVWNDDPGSDFYQALDAEKIGLGGHSHGAAWMAMREYEPINPGAPYEIDCIFLLTTCPHVAMEQYLDVYAGMPPVTVVYGSRDQDGCTAGGQSIAIYEPGTRPKHYTYVVGGSHYGFTDDGPLGAATITRTEHQRAAVSSYVPFLVHILNDDESALPYLRGELPLLEGPPDIRYQYHDADRVAVDHFETGADSIPSVAIAGIPEQTFINGFLSDTFVDFEAGVNLIRAEIQALLPPDPSEQYRVLFYEDDALGPDAYGEALDREVAAGLIQPPLRITDPGVFASLIFSEPWDLIISAQQNGSSSAIMSFDANLSSYVCGGGRLILSDFRVDSPTARDALVCSQSDYDGITNWSTMTSTGGLFTGSLAMANPGWGIWTYGLATDAVVFAVNEHFSLAPGDVTVNSLGLPVTEVGLATFEEEYLLNGPATVYHPTWGLEVAWTDPGGSFTEALTDSSGSGFDATPWPVLSFRVLQLYGDPLNPHPETQDFHVRVLDVDDAGAQLPLSDAVQGPLRHATPPGPGWGWKSVFETYRFPLSWFRDLSPGLDIARLASLQFVFDITPTGRLFFDDIEFTAGDEAVATVAFEDPVRQGLSSAPAVSSFPNPFRASTRIFYRAPQPGSLRVDICDAQGRMVRTLFDGLIDGGEWTGEWDGVLASGLRAVSGTYFMRFDSDRGQEARKVVLIR